MSRDVNHQSWLWSPVAVALVLSARAEPVQARNRETAKQAAAQCEQSATAAAAQLTALPELLFKGRLRVPETAQPRSVEQQLRDQEQEVLKGKTSARLNPDAAGSTDDELKALAGAPGREAAFFAAAEDRCRRLQTTLCGADPVPASSSESIRSWSLIGPVAAEPSKPAPALGLLAATAEQTAAYHRLLAADNAAVARIAAADAELQGRRERLAGNQAKVAALQQEAQALRRAVITENLAGLTLATEMNTANTRWRDAGCSATGLQPAELDRRVAAFRRQNPKVDVAKQTADGVVRYAITGIGGKSWDALLAEAKAHQTKAGELKAQAATKDEAADAIAKGSQVLTPLIQLAEKERLEALAARVELEPEWQRQAAALAQRAQELKEIEAAAAALQTMTAEVERRGRTAAKADADVLAKRVDAIRARIANLQQNIAGLGFKHRAGDFEAWAELSAAARKELADQVWAAVVDEAFGEALKQGRAITVAGDADLQRAARIVDRLRDAEFSDAQVNRAVRQAVARYDGLGDGVQRLREVDLLMEGLSKSKGFHDWVKGVETEAPLLAAAEAAKMYLSWRLPAARAPIYGLLEKDLTLTTYALYNHAVQWQAKAQVERLTQMTERQLTDLARYQKALAQQVQELHWTREVLAETAQPETKP